MSDANDRGKSEPLTEAEFVDVTRREAFQRFGHEGQARVLAALFREAVKDRVHASLTDTTKETT